MTQRTRKQLDLLCGTSAKGAKTTEWKFREGGSKVSSPIGRKCVSELEASTAEQGFPGGLAGKESAMQETLVLYLGLEDPLENGMATHSSILAWRIPMDKGVWQATVHGVAKSHTTQ